MSNLLFFTAVDSGYECFIPLYVYFASKHNPDADFEFLVKDLDNQFEQLIFKFKKEFNINNLKLRSYDNNISAITYRFLEEPITKCKYTYIGDIDLFITENILKFHLNEMKKYDTIYDNKIRLENHDYLSGLHFVKTDEWYEKTKETRKKYFNKIDSTKNNTENCERILKNIVLESNIKLLDNVKENTFNRPAHGIHISLSRVPFTDKMFFPSSSYKKIFIDGLFKHNDYEKLKPFLNDKMIDILNKCTEYVNEN